MESNIADGATKALKIFTKYTGFKPYVTIALTGTGWILFSSSIAEIAKSNNVSDDLIGGITFSIIFGVSGVAILAIERGFKKWRAYRKLQNKKKYTEQRRIDNERKKLQARNRTIEDLPKVYKYHSMSETTLLRTIYNKGDTALSFFDDKTVKLERQGFIVRGTEVDSGTYLYYLTSDARDFLEGAYYEGKMRQLTSLIKKYGDDWKPTLSLFFNRKVPFGTLESGHKIPSVALDHLKHMSDVNVIRKNGQTFTIDQDFSDIVVEKGMFRVCYRDEVTLDKDMIEGPQETLKSVTRY